MRLSTLTNLYRTVDDCVSVYAPRDAGWAAIKGELDEHGLEWPGLEALDEAITAGLGPDDAGVAAFAWADLPAEAHGLPVPPERCLVVRQPLPYAAPLLEVAEISVPHVVVTVADEGSEVLTFRHDDESDLSSVDTDRESGFESLVVAVNAAARAVSAELAIVVAPDLDRHDLIDRLSAVVPVECEVTGLDPAEGDIADATVRLVSDRTARGTVEALQRFRFARSHDSVVEGVADTIDALEAGRVRLLLVHDDPDDDRRVWVGHGATHIATSPSGFLGDVGGAVEVRLTDAAIRSCLLAGGRAHSIPEHLGDGPAEGIGATLVT